MAPRRPRRGLVCSFIEFAISYRGNCPLCELYEAVFTQLAFYWPRCDSPVCFPAMCWGTAGVEGAIPARAKGDKVGNDNRHMEFEGGGFIPNGNGALE